MDDTRPEAIEHTDDLGTAPTCQTCGTAMELVMLERFTGWWCRECAAA